MKITLLGARAKNFLQIGNEFEKFDLSSEPFTVIVGKNGTGKSTLLDIITYGLYKKPYRPKIKLGQLINTTNKKNMVVEIAFKIGNSTYMVRRGEKPKLFEVYKDKELIEPDPSIGDMQKQLEEVILRQNFKTFCQINVIGKATYKQFMDLTPAERRGVVEDILDSNIYSVMQALAKDDLKTLNTQEADLARDIQIIENDLTRTEAILKKYNEDRQGQIQDLSQKKQDLEIRHSELNSDMNNISELILKMEKKMDAIIPSNMLEPLKARIKDAEAKLWGYREDYKRANDIINKIDNLTNCPNCHQVVDAEHKKEIILQENIKRVRSEEDGRELNLTLKKYKEKEAEYDAIKHERDEYKRDHSQKDYQGKILDEQINSLDEQLRKLNVPLELDGDLRDPTDIRASLTEKTNDRDALIVTINQHKDAIKILGDDGIKAQLISKYIPVINNTVNEYLNRMNMFVEFYLDSEFNETVNAINREGFTYHSFSEGQKMRIDLAILLTWRRIAQLRNSMTTNIFILDEVADGSLDDDGMAEFLSILKEVADAQNTFIVSHKESTMDLFDSIIKVETVGNFSKYTHE